MDKAQELERKFARMFGGSAKIYRAPGRVNLIGEHTDYNDGFVLPAAIGFYCWAAIARRDDRKLVAHSENFGDTAEANLDSLRPHGARAWAGYPFGVAWALEQSGKRLGGANLLIHGEVPLGAGLSSSAAIEVATGYALLDSFHHAIDRKELALLCQRAENDFVGARCGIMDQFISCHGRAGHAILLDCRSLDFRAVRLPAGVRLVICNTMVKHELGAGEYNTRRAECEEGVRRLREALPGIRALRDVTLAELETHRGRLPDTIYRRCRYVITENARTQEAAAALEAGDTTALGRLMADSHRSLRDDYEVSCRELDLMVELAARQRGLLGARMTGGGFGGCTINLVAAAEADEFKQRMAAEYAAATGIRPDIYACEASEGAEAVAPAAEAANQPEGKSLNQGRR